MTTRTVQPFLPTTTNLMLMADYITWGETLHDVNARRHAIEQELMRRMDADGATELVAGAYRATMTTPVQYDPYRLMALLELVPEEELVEAEAYIPEHEETFVKAAQWNGTRLRPFAKRGKDVANAIEAACILGAPRLKIEKREDTP